MPRAHKLRFPPIASFTLAFIAWGLLLTTDLRAEEDFRYWQGLSVAEFDGSKFDISTYAEVRFRDQASELFQYLISQRTAYDVHPNLTLGANYTYISSKLPDDRLVDGHRLELEINPHWRANERLTFELRNRLETLWLTNGADASFRSRHRFTANYGLHFWKPLTALYASDEVFIDYTHPDIFENRLVPLGLRFRLAKGVGWNTYFVWQSIRLTAASHQIYALGSQLNITF